MCLRLTDWKGGDERVSHRSVASGLFVCAARKRRESGGLKMRTPWPWLCLSVCVCVRDGWVCVCVCGGVFANKEEESERAQEQRTLQRDVLWG